MAYDEELADRVRALLAPHAGVSERKMFGGIAWMVEGNMACGIIGEELIVRLGEEDGETALAEPETRPFDFTGKPMRGFVCVAPAGVCGADDLAGWVESGVSYAATLPAKER